MNQFSQFWQRARHEFKGARRAAQDAFRELPEQPEVFRSGRLQVGIVSCALFLSGRGKFGFILAIALAGLAVLVNAVLGLIHFGALLFVRPRSPALTRALNKRFHVAAIQHPLLW